MKLLEKDIHEKQDTIVSLRRQLEDIKQINLEMYNKLQVLKFIKLRFYLFQFFSPFIFQYSFKKNQNQPFVECFFFIISNSNFLYYFC